MKKLFKKGVYVLLLIFSFSSCQKEEDIASNESLNITYEDRIQNIMKLNESFISYNNYFNKLKITSVDKKEEEKLVNSIVYNSKTIFNQLGIEEKDIVNLSEGNSDDVYVAFGIALVYSYKNQNNLDSKTMKGGEVGDCLMKATGLNALVALGDAAATLYAGEVTASMAVDAAAAAAFKKAALQAAKKIILRAAGGFGAVIMVAEFTTCMMA